MLSTPLTRREILRLGAMASAAAALPVGAAAESRTPNSDEVRRIDAIAAGFLAEHRAPGLSTVFAHHGRIVFRGAYGLTNIAERQPVTAQTNFRVASISKCFTSVALYTLLEQKKLTLDDLVLGAKGILPQIRLGNAHRDWLESIRVRHLMTHTGGGWSHDPPDPMGMWPRANQHELIDNVLTHVPPDHAPGEHFAYSNFGYLVLGRVIEQLSNMPYQDYVRQHVLTPCGIAGMYIGDCEPRTQGEASYYPPAGVRSDTNVARHDSCGGWVATPTDLVTFLLHVDGFPDPPDILTSASLYDMTIPTAANMNYAKGWAVNRAETRWHNGKLPGSSSIMLRTEHGMCWAGIINRSTATGSDDDVGLALDKMMWQMARCVPGWGSLTRSFSVKSND